MTEKQQGKKEAIFFLCCIDSCSFSLQRTIYLRTKSSVMYIHRLHFFAPRVHPNGFANQFPVTVGDRPQKHIR